MKKKQKLWPSVGIGLLKMIRIMRFTIFIVFITLTQGFAASSFSQQVKLSLNMKNARLEEVIDEIEKKSDFFFLYNKDRVNIDQKVDIQVDEQGLNEVLDKVFKNS